MYSALLRKKRGVGSSSAINAYTVSSACVAVLLLSGCIVDERPRHRHPEPVTVIERPAPVGAFVEIRETPPPPPAPVIIEAGAPPPPPQVIVVQAPPPPPRVEVIPVRPSHRHIWLAGHWRYYGGRYVWIAGRWELPPRPHAIYIAPRWEVRGGSHVFIEGYWHS